MQRSWRLPEYIVCSEAGPDHKKEFTVVCRLETLSEKGFYIKAFCINSIVWSLFRLI